MSRKLGSFGEDRAAAYLRQKGYKIVARNFACRVGEVDIIAEKGDFIIFAEVKFRRSADFAQAREFVTAAKQARIIKTAELWLCAEDCEKQPRFDVIEVYAPRGEYGTVRINHIEDAFM